MSRKDSKTIADSMEETRERHLRFLRAVNNPVRREILRALKGGPSTIERLESATGLDTKTLGWHLSILEYGYCVEKEEREGIILYVLTEEGEVVDYVEE